MKKIFTLFILALVLLSCKEDDDHSTQHSGSLSLSFAINNSSTQRVTSGDISYAIVSIESEKGEAIYTDELLPMYNFDGTLITKTLSLKVGKYSVTKFLLTDSLKNVLYATPTKDSKFAYLVSKPLPVGVTIQKDATEKLELEVVSTTNTTPGDFGYSTFTFNVQEKFAFLIGTFIYNKAKANFELTGSTMEITSDSGSFKYTEELKPVTTTVTLPAFYKSFTISIKKDGYKKFISSYTLDSLKKNFSNPLMIILEDVASSKLIAHYSFNGVTEDVTGNGHNGVVKNGQAVYETGRKGDVNGAINFSNGSSMSATIGRHGSITVAAWVNMHAPNSWYPTILEYRPADLTQSTGGFFFHIYGSRYPAQDQGKVYYGLYNEWQNIETRDDYFSNNPITYNVWNHVAVTYDSATQVAKMYVNSVLIDSQTCNNSLYDQNLSEITVGRLLITNPYDPTNFEGRIDDLRIYNEALPAADIEALHKL